MPLAVETEEPRRSAVLVKLRMEWSVAVPVGMITAPFPNVAVQVIPVTLFKGTKLRIQRRVNISRPRPLAEEMGATMAHLLFAINALLLPTDAKENEF